MFIKNMKLAQKRATLRKFRKFFWLIGGFILYSDLCMFDGLLNTSTEYNIHHSATTYAQLGPYTTLSAHGCEVIALYIFLTTSAIAITGIFLYSKRWHPF
jgi:hypothetical protein